MIVIGLKISRKCQKLPMLVVFCHFLTRYTPLKLFPARFFPASISRKIFPQDFPARFSRKNFPQDFPARFSRKLICDFPARISRKIGSRKNFPQEFQEFAKFPAIIFPQGLISQKSNFPPDFPARSLGTPNQWISRKRFPARISRKNFPQKMHFWN